MKRFILYSIACCGLVLFACKKTSLNQINPNDPTPESLTTEDGVQAFALGIFQKWIADVPSAGESNIMVMVQTNHSILGDEIFSPYGNWGWRYVGQVDQITLPNGTAVRNPLGKTLKEQLQSTNSRQAGEINSFMYEWNVCYFMNVQANLLLSALENSALQFTGDAATKRNTLKAWAYWWKGFAYSRIGSMYLAGVINNDANSTTNGNFVDRNAIIAEADKNFESCLTLLNGLTVNETYNAMMTAIVPSFNRNDQIVTPQMWARQIYSYKARNILVNKKVAAMTAADWTAVQTNANKGLLKTDYTFRFGMDPNSTNDLTAAFFHPYTLVGEAQAFTFVSERLVQDYKPTDARLAKGFEVMATGNWQVNPRGRGLQFGTRWAVVPIEAGGLYATNDNQGTVPIGCSWEENALMLAEYGIRNGNIEAGLGLIDEVRDFQASGLAHVQGTGLALTAALEELRLERRGGLFLRGVAFYDARRWGVTAPVSAGGGRKGGIVLVPGSYTNTTNPQPLPCTLDYNYLDYWDVPQNELDFNGALTGSAPIKN
ncbi:hypothetical protein HNQ91_004652 [Filimonas zeae]|uniref:hypothetical protein n=1 Tax=Filimonas zeae TaxID=1737353 RepID=UPI00166B6A5A|nr:hypothetical protein [Filimonas zeae]MDR6341579.1 hypothetical protein [Filimonas zeae]